MDRVVVVLPEGVDDPLRPSGGNTFDSRVCAGLGAHGWSVDAQVAPGSWPAPDAEALAALARLVASLPTGTVVLVDGLVASAAADVLCPEAARVRLVVLLHAPLAAEPGAAAVTASREAWVLGSAAAVVTTSAWARRWVLGHSAARPRDVHVAVPGADVAPLAPGTADGGSLLCVASVTAGKGYDVLVRALAEVAALDWTCTCVGSVVRDPSYAAQVARLVSTRGLDDRVHLAGPLTGRHLDAAYATADLLVLASRRESYGMVVTEALARGLPVVGPDTGGVAEALGVTSTGRRPGRLVPPGQPTLLAGTLRSWLTDARLREAWRSAARDRRTALPGWSSTTADVAGALRSARTSRTGVVA